MLAIDQVIHVLIFFVFHIIIKYVGEKFDNLLKKKNFYLAILVKM